MNGRGWGFAVGLSKCCWGFSFLVGFGEVGKMLRSDGVRIVGVDLLLM